MTTKTKYNTNKAGCYLKWVGINEFDNKQKKELYLSIDDTYFCQIFLKDLAKNFADVFLGLSLSPTQENIILNSFAGSPLYAELRNLENDTLIIKTNSIFIEKGSVPDIKNDSLIFGIQVGNINIFNPPNNTESCGYFALYFYVNPAMASEFSAFGIVTGHVRLLVSDIFNFIHFTNFADRVKYFDENKYISKIEYKAPSNAFGLVYENVVSGPLNNTNILRLPVHLDFPQFKNKEEIYRNSQGYYTKINATSEKEYKLLTDYLSQDEHECLSIAFLHPTIKINNLSYFQSSGYDIKHNEEIGNIEEARAETKFVQSPYNTQNPNFRF